MDLTALSMEQRAFAVCVIYLGVRFGSGVNFEKNVVALFLAFVGYVCVTTLKMSSQRTLEVCFCVGCVITLITMVVRGMADVLVLGSIAGALSKPDARSLDGEALRGAFVAARDKKAESAGSFWDRVIQRAQATFDDILASLASHAADVSFVDLHIALLARVTLGTQRVLLLGAFRNWFNLSLHSPTLADHILDLLSGRREPERQGRTILVRLPDDARPGQKRTTILADGTKLDFLVPPNARPGSTVVLNI